jgi:hypothetical protein
VDGDSRLDGTARPGADLGPCPLCGRPLIEGPSIDRHHWVPRTRGGRVAGPLHRICHRMLHRVFSETELAGPYAEPDAIRTHPEMARFLLWVRRQPPEYVGWPRAPARKRGNRRRAGGRR